MPVVLYCGRNRWTAADSVRPLVLAEPAALAGFVPGFRYILIDERRCELLGLEQRNLVDAMIRCGRAASAPAASEEVLRLQEWLRGDANAALRRAFVTWLDIVLIRPQFPEVKLKAGDGLAEVAKVLGSSMTWIEQAETKGRAKGREEALRDTFQRVVRSRFGEPFAEAVASLSRPFESGEAFSPEPWTGPTAAEAKASSCPSWPPSDARAATGPVGASGTTLAHLGRRSITDSLQCGSICRPKRRPRTPAPRFGLSRRSVGPSTAASSPRGRRA